MFNRFRRTEGRRYGSEFDIFHIPRLIYIATGEQGGHTRLFSRKPLGGAMVRSWNQISREWALIRRWHIPCLLTIVHVDDEGGKLKSCTPAGWHFHLPKVTLKKEYQGFTVRWSLDKGYTA